MLGDQRDPETHLPWFVFQSVYETFHHITYKTDDLLAQVKLLTATIRLHWSFELEPVTLAFGGKDGLPKQIIPCSFICCASWTLCQRRSSRRYRKPFIYSPWASVCQRPCKMPKNIPTASGTRNLSPNWVRRWSSFCNLLYKSKYLASTKWLLYLRLLQL